MKISLIVAMARNRVIGLNNKMPWHLPVDFAYFKQTTMGSPIIMGRKTFESIGKPLPGRRNIVISRNPEWRADSIEIFASLSAALSACKMPKPRADIGVSGIFIIGGGMLYHEALPLADRLYVTEVDAEIEGDTFFPEIESSAWKEASRTHREADEKNPYALAFVVYDSLLTTPQ